MGLRQPLNQACDHGSGEAGFTIIEVVAVLVIAALLTGAVMFANQSSGGAAQVRALAGAVAAGLRHTRSRAIKRGREIVAHIDIGHRQIRWGTQRKPLNVSRNVALTIESAESERRGTVAGIRFFPNGSSTGGRLKMTSGRTRFDVAINWLTGRVSVERAK